MRPGDLRSGALPFGVNIIGYSSDVSSFSEVVHLTAEALRSVDVPFVLAGRDADDPWPETLPVSDTNPYRFNLAVTGIDPAEPVGWRLGGAYGRGRYNIALSPWEHEEVPKHLCKNLEGNVEVWAPSSFVAEAFSRSSSVPVVRVPHPMRPRDAVADARSELLADVPGDAFVFLFVFNFLRISYGRKNPEAAIAAFREAFTPGEAAALVIKGDFKYARGELPALRERAAGHDGICILDASLTRRELDRLVASCDCYISMHRSEGFGMTMAEAMAFGKPVIATRYGGNLDFMTDENGYLVDYELVRVPASAGPRRKGLLWAEPDVGHAARLMRHVFEHRDEARRKGEVGRADVRRLLSLEEIGQLMKERLLAIDLPG